MQLSLTALFAREFTLVIGAVYHLIRAISTAQIPLVANTLGADEG